MPQRKTKQWDIIVSVLETTDRPLTRHELWEAAKARLPAIGFATVSRAVNALLEEGYLVGLQYPGQPSRYEKVARDEHPHFICNRCRQTFDLDCPMPFVPLPKVPGIALSGYEVLFFGLCSACRVEG